jgi:hypothetical protein
MNEAGMRRITPPAQDSQARRAERGIVAGYIHELSRRHEELRARGVDDQPAPEPGDGG